MCKTGGPRCQRHVNQRLTRAQERYDKVSAAHERGEATDAVLKQAQRSLAKTTRDWESSVAGITTLTNQVAELDPSTPQWQETLTRAQQGLATRIRQSQDLARRQGRKIPQGVFIPLGRRRFRVTAIHAADPDQVAAARAHITKTNTARAARGIPLQPTQIPPLYQLAPSEADTFRRNMLTTKERNPHAAAVDVYSTQDYQRMTMLLTPDGCAGVAVKPDGDVVSVHSFTAPEARYANNGQNLVATAATVGGDHLDCFDTILPTIYARAGFQETGRMAWDDQYTPDGWDHTLFMSTKYPDGKPDVVMMSRVR